MSKKIINTHVLEKRDSSTNWANSLYTPMNGERILVDFYEAGVYKYTREKIGDGVTTYNRLPFLDEGLVNANVYKNKIHTNLSTTDDDVIVLTPTVEKNDEVAAVYVAIDAKHAKVGPVEGFESNTVPETDKLVKHDKFISVPSLTVNEYGHVTNISENVFTFDMTPDVVASGDEYITAKAAGLDNQINIDITHKETLENEVSVKNETTSIGVGETKSIKIPAVVVNKAGHITEISESEVQISIPAQDSNYLGHISSIDDLSTTAKRGEFYRVSSIIAYGFDDDIVAHVGDIIIAEKDNPSRTLTDSSDITADWYIIHCHMDTDTDTYVDLPELALDSTEISFSKYENGSIVDDAIIKFTSNDNSVSITAANYGTNNINIDLSVNTEEVGRLSEEDITNDFNSIFGTNYIYEAVTV